MALYKSNPAGTPLQGAGRFIDRTVHSEDELEHALDAGWSLTPADALVDREEKMRADAPPTADELRHRVRELGLVDPALASYEDLKALVLVAEKFGASAIMPPAAPASKVANSPSPEELDAKRAAAEKEAAEKLVADKAKVDANAKPTQAPAQPGKK